MVLVVEPDGADAVLNGHWTEQLFDRQYLAREGGFAVPGGRHGPLPGQDGLAGLFGEHQPDVDGCMRGLRVLERFAIVYTVLLDGDEPDQAGPSLGVSVSQEAVSNDV